MADNANQVSDMSPFSGHTDYTGYYGNEEMQFEGFDQPSSLRNPTPF